MARLVLVQPRQVPGFTELLQSIPNEITEYEEKFDTINLFFTYSRLGYRDIVEMLQSLHADRTLATPSSFSPTAKAKKQKEILD
jgi:hypothetical protein